jgi:hypothetical protein
MNAFICVSSHRQLDKPTDPGSSRGPTPPGGRKRIEPAAGRESTRVAPLIADGRRRHAVHVFGFPNWSQTTCIQLILVSESSGTRRDLPRSCVPMVSGTYSS